MISFPFSLGHWYFKIFVDICCLKFINVYSSKWPLPLPCSLYKHASWLFLPHPMCETFKYIVLCRLFTPIYFFVTTCLLSAYYIWTGGWSQLQIPLLVLYKHKKQIGFWIVMKYWNVYHIKKTPPGFSWQLYNSVFSCHLDITTQNAWVYLQ